MAAVLHRSNSPSSDDSFEYEKEGLLSHHAKRQYKRGVAVYVLACILAISLVANTGQVLLAQRNDERKTWKPTSKLYSPANDAIQYKLVNFGSTVGDGSSVYQGPPDEHNNKLWRLLYTDSLSGISASEARLLPNRTASSTPWLNAEESKYAILLNAFHNLHCLDRLRQTIWYFHEPQFNATWNPYSLYNGNVTAALRARGGRFMSIAHADHCIDMLRQSAMCEGDVTPIVYQYSERTGKVMGRTGVLHQCRDFDQLQRWAKAHVTNKPEVWGKRVELGLCAADEPETCLKPAM